jgi:hypothetical protein
MFPHINQELTALLCLFVYQEVSPSTADTDIPLGVQQSLEEPYEIGNICDCMNDRGICCYGTFCSPCLFADNATMTDPGRSWLKACLMYGVSEVCKLAMHAHEIMHGTMHTTQAQ